MKVEELSGALLDYWVARAEGMTHDQATFAVPAHSYSSSWAHGGPIIERAGIQISPPESPVHRHGGPHAGWGDSGLWAATIFRKGAHRRTVHFDEVSPLLVAMRAYVSWNFGTDVPDEVKS